MRDIVISHATEGNLKDVSLAIPKEKLVVFTGLSGSGKSTLLVDVLFNECQRLYLEAMGLSGIRKPAVKRIAGASPAVLVAQTAENRNPRSTVGTMTDAYTDLRMVYEKLAVRTCPHCGQAVSAADCREVTEKRGDEFFVYMDCCECGERMDKLTRTDFSFNTKRGACPECEGLGRVLAVNLARALDEGLSLESGAVAFWEHKYKEYQIGVLYQAFRHYGLPVPENMPVACFNAVQKDILVHGVAGEEVARRFPSVMPPKTVAAGRFEGVVPMLMRRMAEHEGDSPRVGRYFDAAECSACQGERLAEPSRSATVGGVRLPKLATMSLEQLADWIAQLRATLPASRRALAEDYLRDIETKLDRFLGVGLGYLSLDRQIVTLSGGELQRVRLGAALDSELSGIVYIMDEPTLGLHPRDTAGMMAVLKSLCDRGNTVLVIEHDPDVMAQADLVVDIGPGSGAHGGEVVAAGTLDEVRRVPRSATGRYLNASHPAKTRFRGPAGAGIEVRGACAFNLKGIDVDIPRGCLTSVTGPSGSGKSTLVFELIAKGDHADADGSVAGVSAFDAVVGVGQSPIARMKRSNVATYADAYTGIRKAFASTDDAKEKGLTAKHFSFNASGGRCERCEGLGTVTSNMLFFTDVEVVCPVCRGRRFTDEVLSVKYKGRSVDEVLGLSVEDAAVLFEGNARVARVLGLLEEVGLGYLHLGQTLTTLSGGEAQRLKLAKELIGGKSANALYLLDEPTAGLHPEDVDHFLALVDKLVDAGGTVVVVEHNAQVIEMSDWVVDLGPSGGAAGGRVVFSGTPADLVGSEKSATARYLRERTAGASVR